MRFDLDMGEGYNQIRGFAEGQIRINDETYENSVIVTPETVADWEPNCFADITEQHLAQLIELKPDIVLIGTGVKHILPEPVLLQAFFEKHIGIEVMNTAAACRTYNVIMAEGRRVVAGLLLR